MKKLGGSIFFWGILILFCLVFLKFNYELRGLIKNRKQHIGEKVILEGDTATVLGCSFWENSYSLSNGKEIDFDLLDKLEKVK